MRRLLYLSAILLVLSVGVVYGASITLDQPSPRLGDTVTFSYSRPPKINDCTNSLFKCAQIRVQCYQAPDFYHPMWVNYDYAIRPILLGGPPGSDWWTQGGGASCTAELFSYERTKGGGVGLVIYAQTSFEVAP